MFSRTAALSVLGLIATLSQQPVLAIESPIAEDITFHLYSGQLERAADAAREQLANAPADEPTRFALGVTQFLQAVEHLGQQLYRYGLNNEFEDQFGLSGLPVLRLPVPTNPNPEPFTYDKFRGVLERFVDDLGRAERTLATVTSQDIDLQLNLGLVRLDLNGDGQATESEHIWIAFQRVARLRGLNEQNAAQLVADLDGSDVPWLQAYCHLLMSIAEFPLAYDWEAAFDHTFFNLFSGIDTQISRQMAAEKEVLIEKVIRAEKELDAFIAEGARNGLTAERLQKRRTETWPEFRERLREYALTPQGEFTNQVDQMRREIREMWPEPWVEQIADLIAFIHLNNWPLTEPDRMHNVLTHLETVVHLSRENWRRILAETDDRNEWIPNPDQTGIIPGVRIGQDQVDGWHLFLDEFDAVLQGEKLVPHWRLASGFNLRRFFTEPTDFDAVLLAQGTGALPYLEEGEEISRETWGTIQFLMGGNFFRYFVWFN